MSKGLNYLAKARPEAATGLLTFYKKQCQALDDKTRFLISTVTKVANGSERGLRQYAPKALQAGASKQELLDAVLMAFPVCGLTGILDALHVLIDMGLLPEDPALLDGEEVTDEPVFVELLALAELEIGKCKHVDTDRGSVLIFKVDEEKINVFEAVCPHAEGRLEEGDAQGAVITCPLHLWQFNLKNGSNIIPENEGLEPLETEVRDGVLWAKL